MGGMNITVSSLNAQGFFDWNDRKLAIVDYYTDLNPDIIFLQEVTYLPEESPYTQASLLRKSLPLYGYESSSISRLQDSPHYPQYREGLGVISKFPISYSETLVLKRDPADEHLRLIQLVDVVIDSQVVKFANIHFSITDKTEKFAREQLQEVCEILAARGETRIMCGDFNMKDITLHSDLWQDDYTASIQEKIVTYPAESKQVDYFLVPKDCQLTSVVGSPDGLSDHRALTAIILLPQPKNSETTSRIATGLQKAKQLFSYSR